ncbi:RNA-directed DNA polymerase, partial [bacterium]|nr:RNA-directed DNA polymerase [bacterium]
LADSGDYSHVLVCDISDFYRRVYHHKLETALSRLQIPNDSGRRIISSGKNVLLTKFSGAASFGLPIGGPASRILAELALNDIDLSLFMKGIRFVRFVDDYHIYGKSLGELHKLLNDLTRYLQQAEKLSIQQHKTQLLTIKEFSRILKKQIGGEVETEKFKFLSLPIHFDPYSDTAVEDYEELKEAISQFDIIGLLFEELRKKRIHPPYTKKLIKAFIALEPDALQIGVKIVADNLGLLFPIIPQAMMSIHSSANRISEETFDYFFDRLLNLISEPSYILTNEINAAFILKAISNLHSTKSEIIATGIADVHNKSVLVSTLALRVMGHWNVFNWLSSRRSNLPTMTDWERRSFIMASYSLGGEGEHWRNHNKGLFSDFEMLCRNWTSESKQKQGVGKWRLPV